VEPLTDDPDFRAATFLVIDFEGTTPKGHRPEPIEVAALALRHRPGLGLVETSRYQSLIRPPAHAPITPFDTDQNGLRPHDVEHASPAAHVLADLDRHLGDPPYLLVAHNAHTEAAFLYDYREHCPTLASTHLLDTIKLARLAHPGLPSYGLDHLMVHLRIPRPRNRHRAMPDVEVTTALFTHLLTAGTKAGHWRSLRDLLATAGLTPRATHPHQQSLF
jgi:DNA polymerase III epsilon subunit-like protein